jgi:hypothetical protein
MTDDRSLLYRAAVISQFRPQPPRSCGFTGDCLSWDSPAETGNITHFLIRVGSDTATPKYRVPVGCLSLRPSNADSDFFISSYNDMMESESERVFVAGAPDFGTGDDPPTLSGLTVTSVTGVYVGVVLHRLVECSYTAPASADLNEMDGVMVTLRIEVQEGVYEDFPKGWFPFRGVAEATIEFSFLHPATKNIDFEDWIVEAVPRNRFTQQALGNAVSDTESVAGAAGAEPPTGVTATVVPGTGMDYSIEVGWDAPLVDNENAGYNNRVRLYSDSGATTPITGYYTGYVPGENTESNLFSGFVYDPAATVYMRSEAQGVGIAGDLTSWVHSSVVLVSFAAGDFPVQPVTNLNISVAEYSQYVDGRQAVRIQGTYSGGTGGDQITVYQAWQSKTSNPPSYDAYQSAFAKPMDGTLGVDYWLERPEGGDTLWIMVCPESTITGYRRTPGAQEAVDSVAVAAWTYAQQPNALVASLGNQQLMNGVPMKQLTLSFTFGVGGGPGVDVEYWLVNIYRKWTDATFNDVPGVSKYELVAAPQTSPWTSGYFEIPKEITQYQKFEARAVNRAGVENTTGCPTATLTILPSNGFDTTGFDIYSVTDEFDWFNGEFGIDTLSIAKLVAGSALFTDTATFAYSSGGSVTINGDGVTLARGTNEFEITATAATITAGTSTMSMQAAGIEFDFGTVTAYLTATGLDYASANPGGAAYGIYGAAIPTLDCSYWFLGTCGIVDLTYPGTWRDALELGDCATLDVGTATGTVAAGDHNHSGVYATASHNHDSSYSSATHTHSIGAATTDTIYYKNHAGEDVSMVVVTGIPSATGQPS